MCSSDLEHESKYYANAYCNIVMETHFDADGSTGTFLTEKTYKPIKHGQLFFVAGPAGTSAPVAFSAGLALGCGTEASLFVLTFALLFVEGCSGANMEGPPL